MLSSATKLKSLVRYSTHYDNRESFMAINIYFAIFYVSADNTGRGESEPRIAYVDFREIQKNFQFQLIYMVSRHNFFLIEFYKIVSIVDHSALYMRINIVSKIRLTTGTR